MLPTKMFYCETFVRNLCIKRKIIQNPWLQEAQSLTEKIHKSLHFSLKSSAQSQALNSDSDSGLSNLHLPQQPGPPVLEEGQSDLDGWICPTGALQWQVNTGWTFCPIRGYLSADPAGSSPCWSGWMPKCTCPCTSSSTTTWWWASATPPMWSPRCLCTSSQRRRLSPLPNGDSSSSC